MTARIIGEWNPGVVLMKKKNPDEEDDEVGHSRGPSEQTAQ